MRRILLLAIALIIIASVSGFAQNGLKEFYSPRLLGTGSNSSFTFAPSFDTVNPAASGGRQVPVIDFSYFSLIGTGTSSGQSGHIVNLGTSIPTRIGVFSGTGRFISSPFSDLYPGTYGSLNLSFAKDLYRNLYFGFGLGIQAGSDWGLAGDIGFVHTVGPLLKQNLFFLQYFAWGFSVTGIGKGYKPTGAASSYPEIFTPALGASLTLVKTRPFALTFTPAVSFPAFQNVRVTAGGEITIFDLVSLRSAYTFDLNEFRAGTGRPLPVTFGLGVHLDPLGRAAGRKQENIPAGQQGLTVDLAGGWFSPSAWGLGIGSVFNLGFYDRKPPVISAGNTLDAISPNFDGTQDELIIPFSVEDERYVMRYELEIRDLEGNIVQTIRNKEDRPENRGFQNILQRFTAQKEGIPIPENLRWDGKSAEGTVAPDGEYFFTIRAWDDNENEGRSTERNFIVDSSYPEIQVQVPYMVFSPNGDGRQDTLILRQSGSVEQLWTGRFTGTDGEVIREFKWIDSAPPAFEWDGRDVQGILPTDNVYTYIVSATDRGGNETTVSLLNIIINTRPTPITILLEYSDFSPNGDGTLDDLKFKTDVPVSEGVQSWDLVISTASGNKVRTLEGNETVPELLAWDGRDDRGSRLDEGTYIGTFSVLYANGNRPEANTPPFTLDITSPRAQIGLEYPEFSPNGDGSKDTLLVSQESSTEETWTGSVYDADGELVADYTWSGKAEAAFAWDGRDNAGKSAPDGTYRYSLAATDRAGNRGASDTLIFSLDTRETPVQITSDRDHFSPNRDGIHDQLTLYPIAALQEGILSWKISITDAGGTAVKTFRSTPGMAGTNLPESVVWDGEAGDGDYTAELEVEYRNGNKPSAQTGPLVLDTVYPAASTLPEYSIFSPDGDGRQDSVTFRQQTSIEDLWEGTITDSWGSLVRSLFWKGRAASFSWDGRDAQGNRVPDGQYNYVLSSTDKAGNRNATDRVFVRVDTKPTPVALAISSRAFSPNNDGEIDTITLKPTLEQTSGIDTWELTVRDDTGAVRRTESGRSSAPKDFLFNGNDERGRRLPEGTYTASLSIMYKKGSEPTADSAPFLLDITPPTVTVSPDTRVFSPNGDGKKDIVVFSQEGSRETSWQGIITDEKGNTVRQFSWQEEPQEELAWDGRNMNGKPVSDGIYRYTLSSVDAAGNSETSPPASIEVDTRETSLRLETDLTAFSPNGDNSREVIRITPVLGRRDGVESYTFNIVDDRGKTVLERTDTASSPPVIVWDGKDGTGAKVKDGFYRARLSVLYRNGNDPNSQTPLFELDTVGPDIALSYDHLLFSPDGDGKKDTFVLRQISSREDLWNGKIIDSGGKTVRTMTWNGKTGTLVWNGRDRNGNIVPQGSYTYVIEAEDNGGNRVRKDITGIGVDPRATPIYITASTPEFSPNGDGKQDTITLQPFVELREGIASWKVEMIHPERGVQKRFEGKNTPPSELVWNGMGDAAPAADGAYQGRLTVIYAKGNTPAASAAFSLDTSPPEVELAVSPTPFSPDNDGLEDELFIDMEVADTSEISSWSIRIIDPAGNIFSSYSGVGEPSKRIIWDGISDRGELVQSAEDYTLVMNIEDNLGNAETYEQAIPVDVLVLREGNRLKIIISSIIFAPNTADYSDVEEEKALKNTKTLRRLAQIFKKYSRYRIHIEGHAAMVHWDNPARAEREQQEELIPLSKNRAEAVKEALVELGIDKNRITTEGVGGARPLVAHSDDENRWKNRRVEFILVK